MLATITLSKRRRARIRILARHSFGGRATPSTTQHATELDLSMGIAVSLRVENECLSRNVTERTAKGLRWCLPKDRRDTARDVRSDRCAVQRIRSVRKNGEYKERIRVGGLA